MLILCVYLINMKAKLNLTIERDVLSKIKQYAVEHNKSVSQIVEEYFESISRLKKKESFVDMIDKLKKPSIDRDLDLVKEYYETKAKKYGF
jgi:hypothetical protein